VLRRGQLDGVSLNRRGRGCVAKHGFDSCTSASPCAQNETENPLVVHDITSRIISRGL